MLGLVVLCLASALCVSGWQIKTLLVEPLRADLRLSDVQIGHLNGLLIALMAALAAFPIGLVADRWDRRRVLGLCALFWAASVYAIGFAGGFNSLLFGMVCLSIGEAAMLPVIYALTTQVVAQRGLATANALVYSTLVLSGGVILSAGGLLYSWLDAHRQVLPWADAGDTWRLMFFLAAVPAVVVAALLQVLRLRSHAPSAAVPTVAHPPLADGYGGFMRQHGASVVLVHLALSCLSIGWMLLTMWMPAILKRAYSTDVGTAGSHFGVATICASVAGLALALWWTSRRKQQADPAGSLVLARNGAALALLPMIGMAFAGSELALLVMSATSLTFIVMAAAQAPSLLQGMSPVVYMSRTIAILPIVALPLRGGMPVLVGVLSEHFGADTPTGLLHAMLIGTGALFVAAVVLLTMARPRYLRLVAFARASDPPS